MNYPHTKQPKYKQLSLKSKQYIGASQLPLSTARRDTAYQLANIKTFFKLLATDCLPGETGTPNIHTGAPDWLQREGETYDVL